MSGEELKRFSRAALKVFALNPGATQKKHGTKEDGRNAAHILSYEILTDVYDALRETNPEAAFDAKEAQRWVEYLDRDDNLRMKTRAGNMWGGPGNPGDRKLDLEIRHALRDSAAGKTVTLTKAASKRMARVCLHILGGPGDDAPIKRKFIEMAANIKLSTKAKVVRANAKAKEDRVAMSAIDQHIADKFEDEKCIARREKRKLMSIDSVPFQNVSLFFDPVVWCVLFQCWSKEKKRKTHERRRNAKANPVPNTRLDLSTEYRCIRLLLTYNAPV